LLIACGLALGAAGARAQECERDADCNNEGKFCASEPDEGECEWKSCEDDGDCPEGFACEPDDVGTAVCPRSGCPEPEPAAPSGRCKPQPVACGDDSDCPNGLVCRDECEASEADDESCEPDARVCWLAVEECDSDADCDLDGFACLVSERDERCQGSASQCRPGAQCEEPDAMAPECEIVEHKMCLPMRVDCTTHSDCDEHWSCFELPDPEDAPPDWQGATHVCLPEGWTMAYSEQIEAGGFGQSASEAGGGGKRADTLGEEAPRAQGVESDDEAAEDGGCEVGAVGDRPSAVWPGLLLIALALLRVRSSRHD
jgi:hypothetical protein